MISIVEAGVEAGDDQRAVIGRVRLRPGWSLWRDVALRSAGFPVDGLDVFGPDEGDEFRIVAGDQHFREAVTWQNPTALANAVDRVRTGGRSGSDQRRREQVVASYWQRYCAKNDTIGFFGPLAWAHIADDSPALAATPGAELIAKRSVHLESWGVQALAEHIDPALRVALGPHSEHELRAMLEAHEDHEIRERALAALDRLEAARDVVADASPGDLAAALAALDDTFEELTGRTAFRNPGRAYGARTLSYVDCMRDVDVAIGPELLAELGPAMQLIFEAGRWYSGRVHAVCRATIAAALPAEGTIGLGAVLGRVMPALMALPEPIAAEVAELQRRVAQVVDGATTDDLGARAAGAFADHEPAWASTRSQSVDIQVAAASADAVAAGDYLAVLSDMHPGHNPLVQSLFGSRHPDLQAFMAAVREDNGGPGAILLPPWGPMQVDARGVTLHPPDAVHVAGGPLSCAPDGVRTWQPGELLVEGWDVVHPTDGLRVPLLDVLGLPMFVVGVRTFEPFADAGHNPRLTLGRVVLRRETWHAPADSVPRRPDELAAWASSLGMPRRLFVKSPTERKPVHLDLESPALRAIACRQARQAAESDPSARMRFSEMLPLPEDCWLRDGNDRRYTSEFRFVGVADE